MPELELTSDSFKPGEPIPERHTCSGEGTSPPLAWSSVPEGSRTLALIVHDPADGGIEENKPAPVEGTGGFGRPGYSGPCPPPGDGPHRYYFRLYALDTALDLEAGAAREQLENAIDGHGLAEAELMGTFERTAD